MEDNRWINPAYSCEGKEKFAEERHAKAASRRKKGRAPYRCTHCSAWHIGSLPPKAARNKS